MGRPAKDSIMKKWFVIATLSLAVVAACVGCVGIGVIILMPTRPSVMKKDVDRIEEGMTLDEVTAILGPSHFNHVHTRNVGGAARGRLHVWNVESPVGLVHIVINDADSRVVQKTFNAGERIPWWAPVHSSQN
jgi:hypothetical protein